MNLLRLGLRSRLYLGFAVLVALGLGIAAFGMVSLSGLTTSLDRLNVISDNLVRIEEVSRNLEKLEGAAHWYRTAASPDALKDMQEAEEKSIALVNEAIKTAFSQKRLGLYRTIDSELRAAVSERELYTHAYATGFTERAKILSGGPILFTAMANLVQAAQAGEDPARSAAAVQVQATVPAGTCRRPALSRHPEPE